ncbi:MAG: hypothetical protein ICV54_08600, partial [Nostoc sp. C3-bin3]|nr:hypothetical protein [Nostoc sp. C3-bin3]
MRRANPGISVQGSSLKVASCKTLVLVGSDVTLAGSGSAVLEKPNLAAPEGRIELGSVVGVGEVSLNPTDNSWALEYDQISTFGDIQLENGVFV